MKCILVFLMILSCAGNAWATAPGASLRGAKSVAAFGASSPRLPSFLVVAHYGFLPPKREAFPLKSPSPLSRRRSLSERGWGEVATEKRQQIRQPTSSTQGNRKVEPERPKNHFTLRSAPENEGFEVPNRAVQDLEAALKADTVTIVDIFLQGHKRTRDGVVFREMTFGKGARIAEDELEEEIALTYAALMNTALFSSVDISYSDSLLGPGKLQVIIDIRETWYIYPVPVFSLADRNFNVWWRDQNHSLDRVNLGGKLSYYNFTGRRDRFKIGYTTGYTRKYEAGYRLPYLNKAKNIGVELNYSFSQRREQNYQTLANQQVFYQDPNRFVFKDTKLDVSFNYRKRLYVTHTLRSGYRSSAIADTIANTLNPEFFGEGRSSQKFYQLEYNYVNDRRDVRNYPWKGYFLSASLVKDGIGFTNERSGLTAGLTVRKFWPLSEHLSINFGLAGKYSLIRSQQPFLENRAIGFGNNGLVGYQFYVVDGLDMAIWRFGVRRQLFKTDIDLGKLVFIDAFRYIPLRVLFSFQFNQGIANAPFIGDSNELNNTLLTGASVGLDVVLFYDMVGSLQYNRNHLGEGNILLAFNLNF